MNNLTKRILTGIGLGTVAGLLCFWGFSSGADQMGMEQWAQWSWTNPMMWLVIANRFTIGFVVAIAGFITVHPFLNFRIPVWVRGAKFGVLVSLTMTIGVFMGPNPEGVWFVFWMMSVAGAVIGAIIDVIITKFAGQGEDLRN